MKYSLTPIQDPTPSDPPGVIRRAAQAAPVPRKPISDQEFLLELTRVDRCLTFHEFCVEPWNSSVIWQIFWYTENGLGVARDSRTKEKTYWFIGCEHDFQGLSQEECFSEGIPHFGACYYVSRCRYCGLVVSRDSSD